MGGDLTRSTLQNVGTSGMRMAYVNKSAITIRALAVLQTYGRLSARGGAAGCLAGPRPLPASAPAQKRVAAPRKPGTSTNALSAVALQATDQWLCCRKLCCLRSQYSFAWLVLRAPATPTLAAPAPFAAPTLEAISTACGKTLISDAPFCILVLSSFLCKSLSKPKPVPPSDWAHLNLSKARVRHGTTSAPRRPEC